LASWISRTTTVCEVPTKSKLGPYSRDEVLAPQRSFDSVVIVGCLILPPTNHLKTGRGDSTK
jgi:hypothetical protein